MIVWSYSSEKYRLISLFTFVQAWFLYFYRALVQASLLWLNISRDCTAIFTSCMDKAKSTGRYLWKESCSAVIYYLLKTTFYAGILKAGYTKSYLMSFLALWDLTYPAIEIEHEPDKCRWKVIYNEQNRSTEHENWWELVFTWCFLFCNKSNSTIKHLGDMGLFCILFSTVIIMLRCNENNNF